jgi:hypothetical protein
MNCQNCQQPVEAGAAYCGNCGQAQQLAAQPIPVLAAAANIPAYALATPVQHAGETKALLSLLGGVIGLAGAMFYPLAGLILGIFGVVMGTMSRAASKHRLSTLGIIFSSLAIIGGLATWVYAYQQLQLEDKKKEDRMALTSAPAVTTADLSTPCYSLGFVSKLNVTNTVPSCDMVAFNGKTVNSSTDAYKVYANKIAITDASSFTTLAKQAIEKDIQTSLPGFVIDSQKVGSFAGSPAYVVVASDSAAKVTITEAAVLHETITGDNVFILVHAINDKSADLTTLEAQWQWK